MGTADGLIIIPAYNESKNIGQVLKDIRQCNYNIDIIVINDGSNDNTGQVVVEEGEKVINQFYNLGYGGALQTGFKYAVAMEYQFVIQFDGDGQHNPEDLQIIIEQLKTGDYDIVIGSRFIIKNSFQISLAKKLAIIIFRLIIRISTGVKITDPTSGFQGLNQRTFRYYSGMGNFPEDFPDADTLIHMLKSNYQVKEVPVNMKNRLSGKSMHSGFRALYYAIKMLVSISVVLLRAKFKN